MRMKERMKETMKSIFKRGVFFSLVFLLAAFCFPIKAFAADVTAAEAVQHILGLVSANWGAWNNVPNYDGSGWTPYDYGEPQCVDLIAEYWDYLVGWHKGLNAADYANTSLPEGWTREYGDPQPGDIVVWTGGDYGHIGVVVSVANGQYDYVDTNGDYNYWYDDGGYRHNTKATRRGPKDNSDKSVFLRPVFKPSVCVLDVNGWTDGSENPNTENYATFDVYINGSLAANDVSDFCNSYNPGTAYAIKDIRVAGGKAFDGFSGYTRGGYVSGGRTGTLNANTDVRLTLHTVDAAAFVGNHTPEAVSVYNGHSYYFYPASVTWYDAKIISDYLGGHLVSVTSAAENAFIKGMIGDTGCWLGATDKDSEGVWKWITGEAFSYSNWYGTDAGGTEPNNSPDGAEGEENYAHIRPDASNWNDCSSSTLHSFICEFDRAYTITYNANGGTKPPAAQAKAVGRAIALSGSAPTRTGYRFLGWGLSASAAQAAYQPGDTYRQDANLTLYAVWESLRYTITYDANGGANAPDSQTVENGGSVTLSTGVPSRRGYVFLGWSTAQTATAAEYQPGGAYPGGDVTLYAVWKVRQYTVFFDSDGAGSYDPITVNYGETVGALPVPEKHGFFFLGWFTAAGQEITENTVVKTNLRLTALWSAPSELSIPSAVTRIEDEAFEGIGVNVIYIPAGVTYIGSNAFANNGSLYSMVVYSRTVSPASDAFANCPNMTIYGYQDTPIHYYAVAKNIPFEPIAVSDWVQDTEVPIGARLTGEEKWTYDKIVTETTTSPETSLEGWTRDPANSRWEQSETGTNRYVNFPGGFSTGHALYGKYSTVLTNSETETVKIAVGASETVAGYIYYHWTLDGRYPTDAANAGHAINVYIADMGGANPDGYTYSLFHAFETDQILEPTYGAGKNGDLYLTGEGIYSTCYVPAYNHAEYVSYWWFITEIRQQTFTKYQRIFTYTRETTEAHESAQPVVEGGDITNVRHYVKYGF